MSERTDRKMTRSLLRRVALDTLGRTPSPAEAKSFLDAPVGLVVKRVLCSLEAMQVFVEEELFYFLLLDNFRPKTESIGALPKRLADGKASAHDAWAEVLLSTGFSSRNPGNDTFVTVVLEQCLGIKVQESKHKPTLEAGKRLYDGKKGRFLGQDGETQADVVKIVLAQETCTRFMLGRHHERIFGAPPPAADETWKRVHASPREFFVVLAEWLASDAYDQAIVKKKPKSDHQFIRALYMDLLLRVPSYEELRNMRNALLSMADPAPLRAVMAKVILDSGKADLPALEAGKAGEFVRECFVRYLGREPGQEELPEFEKLCARVKPVQLVRALVGSAEYQYY